MGKDEILLISDLSSDVHRFSQDMLIMCAHTHVLACCQDTRQGQSKESQESRQTRLEKRPKVEQESLHGLKATSQGQTKARFPQRGGKRRDLNEKELRIRKYTQGPNIGALIE